MLLYHDKDCQNHNSKTISQKGIRSLLIKSTAEVVFNRSDEDGFAFRLVCIVPWCISPFHLKFVPGDRNGDEQGLATNKERLQDDLNYSLNSFKGVIYRVIEGNTIVAVEGDTRSLDDNPYIPINPSFHFMILLIHHSKGLLRRILGV